MPTAYSLAQVSDAVNAAADAVLDLDRSDERLADVVNLVVNAFTHFLETGSRDLDDAIRVCYETAPDDVKSWIVD